MKFDELYYQIRELEEAYTESIDIKKSLSDASAKLKSLIKDLQDKISKSAKEGKIKEAKDTAKKALAEIESDATKLSKSIEDKLSDIKKKAQQSISVKESTNTGREKDDLKGFLNDVEMVSRALKVAKQGIDKNIGAIKEQIMVPDKDFDCSKLASSINDTLRGIEKLFELEVQLNDSEKDIEYAKQRLLDIRKKEQNEIEAELKRIKKEREAKKEAKTQAKMQATKESVDSIKLTIYESAEANDITDEEKELLLNLL